MLVKLVESGKVRLGEYSLDLAVAKDARLSTTSTLCCISFEDAAGLVTDRVYELEATAIKAETHYGKYER